MLDTHVVVITKCFSVSCSEEEDFQIIPFALIKNDFWRIACDRENLMIGRWEHTLRKSSQFKVWLRLLHNRRGKTAFKPFSIDYSDDMYVELLEMISHEPKFLCHGTLSKYDGLEVVGGQALDPVEAEMLFEKGSEIFGEWESTSVGSAKRMLVGYLKANELDVIAEILIKHNMGSRDALRVLLGDFLIDFVAISDGMNERIRLMSDLKRINITPTAEERNLMEVLVSNAIAIVPDHKDIKTLGSVRK